MESIEFRFDDLLIDINHGAIQIVEGQQEILLLPKSKDEAELMACALRRAAKYLQEWNYE